MRNFFSPIYLKTLVAFAVSLFFGALLISVTIVNKLNSEKMSIENLIVDKSIKITEVVSKLLYKTQALGALVIQSDGEIKDFARVAATIVDDPAILNILIAPSGVVSDVYPLQGNQALIGYDLLGEGAGNKEAIMAKDKGDLVFGGPFKLMQGGQALVGRLPVWLDLPDKGRQFWGLVSVTLKYPEILYGAGLDSLEAQGFAYEIWRINPDDGKKQTIAGSSNASRTNTPFIEKHIPILNAEWYFRILSACAWYHYLQNWALIFLGVCVSLMIACIVQNNCDLKTVKSELENMVRTDPLTGLLNRKGLFYELDHLMARRIDFSLCYLDLDYFKQINDTYGHNVGDLILTEFSRRIAKYMEDGYILARISGDEFVVVRVAKASAVGAEDSFWEHICREFEDPIAIGNGEHISLTFSIGEAKFPEDGKTIEALIACADKEMYKYKHKKYATERRRRTSDVKN